MHNTSSNLNQPSFYYSRAQILGIGLDKQKTFECEYHFAPSKSLCFTCEIKHARWARGSTFPFSLQQRNYIMLCVVIWDAVSTTDSAARNFLNLFFQKQEHTPMPKTHSFIWSIWLIQKHNPSIFISYWFYSNSYCCE